MSNLSTTEREEALKDLAAVTEQALSFRGNSHAQRTALHRIESFAAKAAVAPLDWLQEYFTKKTTATLPKNTEEIYCKGCKVTFKNLQAYNGHGPTKCHRNHLQNP